VRDSRRVQFAPAKQVGQRQVKLVAPSMHVAPFSHGSSWQ